MESKYETEFKQWSNEEYCLAAVEQTGDALRYVAKLSILKKVIKELKIV